VLSSEFIDIGTKAIRKFGIIEDEKVMCGVDDEGL
jgi:hypothetical protein